MTQAVKRTKCRAVTTRWGNGGERRTRCTWAATGADGYCTRCRNLHTPRAYTCRACGTSGLIGPSTCAEHREQS